MAVDITSNLELHLKCQDEAGETSALDSANGHACTVTGGATIDFDPSYARKNGNTGALTRTAAGDFVVCPDAETLNLSDTSSDIKGDITYSCWHRTTETSGNNYLVNTSDAANAGALGVLITYRNSPNSYVQLTCGNQTAAAVTLSTNDIIDGNDHLLTLVLVKDGGGAGVTDSDGNIAALYAYEEPADGEEEKATAKPTAEGTAQGAAR
jgi:hypothetical protein